MPLTPVLSLLSPDDEEESLLSEDEEVDFQYRLVALYVASVVADSQLPAALW